MNIRLTAAATLAAGLLLTACADDVAVDADTTEAPADEMGTEDGAVVEGDTATEGAEG